MGATSGKPSKFPVESCHSTKEELLNEGLKLGSQCQLCQTFGVKCFVGSHPAASQGKFTSFLSLYSWNNYEFNLCKYSYGGIPLV